MSLTLRILCILGSAILLFMVISNIKKKRIQIEDSIFWLLFSVLILIIALFPQLAIALADLIGVTSPSNLVFLGVITILLVRLFYLTVVVSSLKHRLNELAQEEALFSKKD